MQCTWEDEEYVFQFKSTHTQFKKINRALLKEQRQEYLMRLTSQNELKEIFSNQRKYSRQHPAHIHDLKKKVFGFKDTKDVK